MIIRTPSTTHRIACALLRKSHPAEFAALVRPTKAHYPQRVCFVWAHYAASETAPAYRVSIRPLDLAAQVLSLLPREGNLSPCEVKPFGVSVDGAKHPGGRLLLILERSG